MINSQISPSLADPQTQQAKRSWGKIYRGTWKLSPKEVQASSEHLMDEENYYSLVALAEKEVEEEDEDYDGLEWYEAIWRQMEQLSEPISRSHQNRKFLFPLLSTV
ncbi:hypothetical protein JCM3765_000046 [Sporobolomyces pararoseus]